jgi:hypothetical protein
VRKPKAKLSKSIKPKTKVKNKTKA